MSQPSPDDRGLPPLFDIGAALRILWERRMLVLAVAGAVPGAP